MHEKYSELILNYYGDKDTTITQGGAFEKKGEPVRVVQSLWNDREDSRRKLIYLAEEDQGTLVPMFNQMARWRTLLLGRQLESYEKLVDEEEELAPIRYKAEWLFGESLHEAAYYEEKDLDVQTQKHQVNDLLEFLEETAKAARIMKEGEEAFNNFSIKFLERYEVAYPDDTANNRGRKVVKHTGIQNRLEKVGEHTGKCYKLEKSGDNEETGWVLRPK